MTCGSSRLLFLLLFCLLLFCLQSSWCTLSAREQITSAVHTSSSNIEESFALPCLVLSAVWPPRGSRNWLPQPQNLAELKKGQSCQSKREILEWYTLGKWSKSNGGMAQLLLQKSWYQASHGWNDISVELLGPLCCFMGQGWGVLCPGYRHWFFAIVTFASRDLCLSFVMQWELVGLHICEILQVQTAKLIRLIFASSMERAGHQNDTIEYEWMIMGVCTVLYTVIGVCLISNLYLIYTVTS